MTISTFTGRAENYARFRPGYPDAVIDLLRVEAGWSEQATVADIGAGTGISSELFLRHGNRVWAVEPNAEMRAQAESLRTRYPAFEIVDGTAESTTLPDTCADFAVAGQAFHWFNADASQVEFLRILKPQGQTVLMWNRWEAELTPFTVAYEEVFEQFGIGYSNPWRSEQRSPTGRVALFFGQNEFDTISFSKDRQLDLEELIGEALSASYTPLPGHPNYDPMIAALEALFGRFARDGRVVMPCQTTVFWGRPA